MPFNQKLTKAIALTLIFTHLASVVFRDVSFAKAPASKTSTSGKHSTSNNSSPSQSPAQNPPKTRAAKPASPGISLPGFNTSALQSLQNDPFTGRAVFSLPISVPPGRRGIQPNLSLTYSSGSGNGILGLGWNLDLGSIQRSTKRGVPKYSDAEDTFVLASGGSNQELVSIGSSQYRPKIEGSFSKITFDGTSWVVTDKGGTRFYFGFNPDAKQTNSKGTFSWLLSRVEDISGNYLTVEYTSDQGQAYPSKIKYTGNDSQRLTPAYEVEFTWEARPDTSLSYRSGVKVVTTRRLKEIKVKYNNSLIRQYKVDYLPLTSTRLFSLIEKVTLFDAETKNSLPPVAFTYAQLNPKFSDVKNWRVDWGTDTASKSEPWKNRFRYVENDNTYLAILDINADGLPDRVVDKDDSGFSVQLNNGAGFNAPVNWGPLQRFHPNHNSIEWHNDGLYKSLALFDINADGLPDRVYYDSGSDHYFVQLNNSSGFNSPAITWRGLQTLSYMFDGLNGASVSPFGIRADTLDINGDGLPDHLMASRNGSSYDYLEVQLNTGTSFSPIQRWPIHWGPDSRATIEEWGFIRYLPDNGASVASNLLDINGDGLPDRVLRKDAPGAPAFLVQFNNGIAFEEASEWGPLLTEIRPDHANAVEWSNGDSDGKYDKEIALLDINSDGLPDRVIYPGDGSRSYKVQLNTGSGFSNQFIDWGTLEGGSYRYDSLSGETTENLDINGDGFPDKLTQKEGDPYDYVRVQLNDNPQPPNYLTQVQNGLGGSTLITYQPYKGADNSIATEKKNLPFPVWVVKTITQDDGSGNSYATSYSYDSGLFNFSQREFRGFGKVIATDPEGNYSTSYFKQDDAFKGKLYQQETKDKDGRLYTKTENTWQSRQLSPGVTFPYLERSDNYTYEAEDTPRHTAAGFEYDAYGNPTRVTSEGEVEVSGDEKTQVTEYVYNTANWLLSTPKHTYILDTAGNKVSEKWLYYDNHANLDEAPAKGFLTKEESWLANPITKQEERISSTLAYDASGNLTSSTNPRGHTTATTYDPALKIYPLTLTNSLTHTSRSAYDYSTGQVLTSTDPNSQTSRNIYDSLGRLTKVIGPLDNEQYPGIIYEYDLASRPIKVTTRVKADYNNPPNYLTTYSFFDGLGRAIETKSPAEADPDTGRARQIISGIVKFDSRGQVKEKYIPYFADESPDYIAPSFATPHSSLEYDALGRAVKATNPDGTSSSVKYSARSKSTIDENGHQKSYTFDAYGRITEVREYTGAKEPYALYSTTRYTYDTLGNLTSTLDNQGNTTSITYDSLGRKIRMNDPDMGVWSYEYDKAGNLTKQTDAKGQILEFEYDALNRLKKKWGLSPQGTVPVFSVDYLYDDSAKLNSTGRLSKVTYSGGQTDFFYDKLGRETKSVKGLSPTGTIPEQYVVEREYDALDRLTKLTYPDGSIVEYSYNPQGIESVRGLSPQGTVPELYVSGINYSPTGQLTKVTYGNGTETNYHYNPNTLRLDHLTTASSAGVIQDLGYQFDNIGNISQIRDSVNTATQSFIYDDLDRLKTAQGSYGTFGYDYDSIGNLTYKEGVVLRYGEEKQGLSPQGTVPVFRPHAVTRYGDTVITYDPNGNMASKGNLSFTYDPENRLIRAEEAAVTAKVVSTQRKVKFSYYRYTATASSPKIIQASSSAASTAKVTVFSYDADGGRVKKTRLDTNESTVYIGSLYEVSGSLTTKHIFAGSNRIATITRGLSRTTEGSPVGNGTVPEASVNYHHSDHLGSSNVITDSTGSQVGFTEFTPYGSTYRQTGSVDPRHKFTGKELDASTGLYFYGARYYDPALGRFITPDTIVQAPYDPQTLNRYTYCRNNPLNYIDPTGHFWFIVAIIAIAKAAAVGAAIGAAVGGVMGGISAAINGTSIWAGIGSGILSGAISGAASGAAWGTGAVGIGGIFGAKALSFWGTKLALGAFSGAFGGLAGAGFTGASLGQGAMWGAGLGLAGTGIGISPIGQGIGKTIGNTAVGRALNGANNWVGKSINEFLKEAHGGSASAALNANKSETISNGQALSRKGGGIRIDFVDSNGNVIDADPNPYPLNNGFLGEPERMTLQPGTVVDRYGGTAGRYISPQGVPVEARALPPGIANAPLNTYQVLKPFDVYGGPAAPAFNQQGGGMQYYLDSSVQDLLDQGYLGKVE